MRILALFFFIVISLFFATARPALAWIITPSVEDEHETQEQQAKHEEPATNPLPRSLRHIRQYVPPPAPSVRYFAPYYNRRMVYPARWYGRAPIVQYYR
jgi:hypothetical protein